MYKTGRLWITAALLLMVFSKPQGSAGGEKTILALTAAQVAPGNEVYVTVMLSNSPGVDVSQLKHWIEFPKSKLSFVRARLGIAGDLAEAQLAAELDDQPGQDKDKGEIGTLYLSVSGKRPLPDGPVVEITFKIPSSLEEQTITLGHRGEATAADGQKLPQLVFEEGELKVSKEEAEKPPSIFSCFFYMH
ncbi:MAG: hypothetical protein HY644_09230 [Acidobacteria bacterium]|nr:hypothetical protein [Acidobacteriota bacterium]